METLLPLQQHPNFARALRRIGAPVHVIDVAGAHPVHVIRRFGVNYAARGPVWREEPNAQTLRAARLRLINSNGADTHALYAAGFRQVMTPATVAELPIFPDHCQMITRMQAKWRNIWRRAQDTPLVFSHRPFHAEKHAWLLHADLAQQKRKSFRALPHGIIHGYPAQDTRIWQAHLDGEPAAGMLFLRHGNIATYHLGYAGMTGRKYGAHHAMLMQAAHWFAQQDVTQIDLGLLDTENTPGLARFKIGSGAVAHKLGGTWLRLR